MFELSQSSEPYVVRLMSGVVSNALRNSDINSMADPAMNETKGVTLCTGAAVSPKAAVTAATCVFNGVLIPLIVFVCHTVGTERCFPALDNIHHPDFIGKIGAGQGDLAIVQTTVNVFNSYVEKLGGVPTFTNCFFYGTGRSKDIPILGNQSRSKFEYSDCYEKITNSSGEDFDFCSFGDPINQPCEGDLGGPLICEGSLIGVLAAYQDDTWSNKTLQCGKGTPPIYTMFTRIDYYKDWIMDQIKPTDKQSKHVPTAISKTTWTHYPSLASWLGIFFMDLFLWK